MKHKKKSIEFDKEGFIRIYPSIQETKEKTSGLKRLLRLLKRKKTVL